MTPLHTFQCVVEKLDKKPFLFYSSDEQKEMQKSLSDATEELVSTLEENELQDTHAYREVQALGKSISEIYQTELPFLQYLRNLLDIYKQTPQADAKLLALLDDLTVITRRAKKKLLEHHISLEHLNRRSKKMTDQEKHIHDLATIQKIGIFYVLEYTLQVLYEFAHLSDTQKKLLLEKGLTTKGGNLPAYLPLEDTFRKELCYKIYDTWLRNLLLTLFYKFEEVLYNEPKNMEAIQAALRDFNLAMLDAFNRKGLEKFDAVIYAPFGNHVPLHEVIKAIHN